MKLLVIEDNPINLKLMKLIVKSVGIETFYAENGKIALDMISDNLTPNLILCDIQMPVMDGIEFLSHAKKLDQLNSTKIIAITAHALLGDKEKYMKIGFDGYISKPFNTREIRSLLLEN